MEKHKGLLKAAAAVIVMAVIGAAAFLLGRNLTASEYRAEQELNIRINRSELEWLEGIEGPIYVTGHKSPDADTVGSSIAYAELLRELGFDAHPAVLGNINSETGFILKSAGLDVPMLLEDVSGCNIVLVDHSDYLHSADGLENAKVLMIIDHHGDGSVTTADPLIYDARPLGSTATIIWLRYRNYGVSVNPKTAYVMAGSILSDTANFKAESAAFADLEALRELSQLAGISDTNALYQEMFKASLSYDGMSDEEILFSDYKEYESGSKKYAIGCLNAYDEDIAGDLAERMKKVLPAAQTLSGTDIAYAQISIFHDDISITYLVPSDETAAEVLEAAFGDTAVYDGTSFRLEPGISRKRDLVPAITNVLESFPKE